MKNSILIKFKILLLLTITILAGCSDDDQVFDEITGNVTRGAVLRTIDVVSNSVAINSSNNQFVDGELFSVILEEQDQEDGNLLGSVDVLVGYVDNSTGGENSIPERLFTTINASEFSTGEFGLPRTEFSATAAELQSFLGLQSDNIGFGGDQFSIRFVLNLTDGRSFSNNNNSGTITGSFFNSPFLYTADVVCAPSVPTAGTWIIEAADSYGDGWNGASLSIVIDGGAPISIANVADPVETFEVNVPDGAQTISIIYNSGAFDEEVTFSVTSANGNVVAAGGPNPTIGAELLNFCLDNL